MSATGEELKERLTQIARTFYERGWSFATSSNFSARGPSGSILITASGLDKSSLTPNEIVEVDINGLPLNNESERQPSAEAKIHCMLYRWSSAVAAVLHTHSVYSTVVSTMAAEKDLLILGGYEMLKALKGVTSHLHRETIPIFPNSQNMDALGDGISKYLLQNPATHGFLLHAHGLYTWGADLDEAVRHAEALEFLFECEYRKLR
jgi:methylthioribulose-1-phosphate dehydratase